MWKYNNDMDTKLLLQKSVEQSTCLDVPPA